MKWRIYKKVFKKKIKPGLMGCTMMYGEDLVGRIIDVRVSPAGGKKVEFSFTFDKVEPSAKLTHDSNESYGLDLSFEIPKLNEPLKKLWNL